MKRRRVYIALIISIATLFGIIVPIAIGIRDIQLVASIFLAIWFIFAASFFVNTFLIRGRRDLKRGLKEGTNEKWGYS